MIAAGIFALPVLAVEEGETVATLSFIIAALVAAFTAVACTELFSIARPEAGKRTSLTFRFSNAHLGGAGCHVQRRRVTVLKIGSFEYYRRDALKKMEPTEQRPQYGARRRDYINRRS
jgi:hypothetical protein